MPYGCFTIKVKQLAFLYYTIHYFNLALSAERKGGGKNPLNIVSFWDARTPKPPIYCEEWIIKFHWGMIAKHDIDPDDFYFARTLNGAAIVALPEDVNGKNRIESEK